MEKGVIFIGEKPFMNYVTSAVMKFTNDGMNEVTIKARGKWISRAVDVAEVAAKRFLIDRVAVSSIKIDSEQFVNRENKNVRVSTIEILVTRVPEKPKAPEQKA